MLFGCSTTSTQLAQNCDVRLLELDPSEASIGDTVTATGRPMTSVWDTAVFVGSDRASLVDVNRLDCEACDECREAENCDACSDCAPCLTECTETCVEQVSFVVPNISESSSTVSMYNGHGQSNLLPISLVSTTDTGTPDSGTPSDTSAPDTADSGFTAVDSGGFENTDTSEPDTIPTDTGSK